MLWTKYTLTQVISKSRAPWEVKWWIMFFVRDFICSYISIYIPFFSFILFCFFFRRCRVERTHFTECVREAKSFYVIQKWETQVGKLHCNVPLCGCNSNKGSKMTLVHSIVHLVYYWTGALVPAPLKKPRVRVLRIPLLMVCGSGNMSAELTRGQCCTRLGFEKYITRNMFGVWHIFALINVSRCRKPTISARRVFTP